MASEFVRKVKGIRNIDILSPNITTENDLISTIDGEVYVATNKGYKKITGSETEQDIQVLETDVKNLKTSTGNNTTEIETLQTSTDNNTSEIETLKTSLEENTSEIETLKTSTDNNTSEIETLKTSTDNNTSEIETLETKIEDNVNNLNENIKKLNEYIEVKSFNGIDLMDKNSLDGLPLGVNYLIRATNITDEMTTGNGWLTVHYGNNIKRLMFQPYSEGRTYYNYIIQDTLEEWQ